MNPPAEPEKNLPITLGKHTELRMFGAQAVAHPVSFPTLNTSVWQLHNATARTNQVTTAFNTHAETAAWGS
jgi:hypothetical protein